MNIFLIVGIGLVNFAFIFYTIFFIRKLKKKILNSKSMIILFIGILFDISATLFMIIGSKNVELTFHGIVGYIALIGMIIDFLIIFYHFKKVKSIPRQLSIYTNLIYFWWISIYIYGFLNIR